MLRSMLTAAGSLISNRSVAKPRWTGGRLLASMLALILLLTVLPLAAATRSQQSAHKSSTHKKSAHKSSNSRTRRARSNSVRRQRSSRRSASRSRRCRGGCGQQAISPSRTLEIQQALIRQNYLVPGQDTGKWDDDTRAALVRYQGDNHWQTKILPDSRALIKLGLGPKRDNLLNPETAAIGMRSLALLKTEKQANAESTGESVPN